MLTPTSSVRVRNTGDEPFVQQYVQGRSRTTFAIAPGSETVVPYGAAVCWLGDNAKRDDSSKRDLQRTMEKKRLASKWGGGRPSLEVFTIDGDRIVMLLDDVEGKQVLPASPSVADHELMDERLKALEKEIVDLRKRKERATRKASAGADVAEDKPTKVAVDG